MRLVIDLQGAQSDSRGRGIGRYSRALAQAMVRTAGTHEVVLALNGNFRDATEDLRDAFAATLPAANIRVWFGPGRQTSWDRNDHARRSAAENIRAAFLHSLQPDLLLVTSLFEGYGDDAVTALPPGFMPPPSIGICYDLIPLSRPDLYLATTLAQDWYYRRLLELRHLDGLLCISQSAQRDIMAGLDLPERRVENILAGVDPRFRPAEPGDAELGEGQTALLARYGLQLGYILCVGAVEERKNLPHLLRAYASLPPELRRRHTLVATGWNDPTQLPPLRRLAAELGLADSEFRLLTTLVPDADLPGLYRGSAVAICPSLHEGFGLSVAEAMACGVAALCSNTSSLPEVMDRADAQFDPHDPASIAARLRETLENRPFRTELARYGLARAARFTWENTARRAWRAAERFAAETPHPTAHRKPRLALVTPLPGDLPPLLRLLETLSRRYDVTILSPDPAPNDPALRPCFPVLPEAALAEGGFERLVYHPAGDTGVALRMLPSLQAYPGIVLRPPHTAFTSLLQHANGPGVDAIAALLLDTWGWQAAIALRDQGPSALAAYPIDTAVADRAVAVLDPADPALPSAIEAAYASSPAASLDACLTGLAGAGLATAEVARAVARSFRPLGKRTLFLDVSTIAAHDAGTGIQRVVRETVRQLGQMNGLTARMEPVLGTGDALTLARGFGHRLFGLPASLAEPAPAEPALGDVFVGLDLNMHDVGGLAETLHTVRSRGATTAVVIYDLLPVQLPACFPATVQSMFPTWLRTISRLADGLVCISRAVADDLMIWLDANPPARTRPLNVGWFHLGADFRPSEAAAANHPSLAAAAARPTLLMVGTLEPRKGQADALAAMDVLWAAGIDAGLVLAGRPGWLMQGLEQRIAAHPENGRRLHWVQDAGDTLVAALYQSCGALLMASEGEGFGLPVVEAARAGLPVITRDLPVFREICGDHALYFANAAALPATLRRWLALRAEHQLPDPAGITAITWQQSSHRLAQIVLEDNWYAQWNPHP